MPRLPHIAILGRPNVGKSTLFNRLIGRRLAIVDSTPGVTRDRLESEFEWEGVRYRVSDLAGWDENPENPFASETIDQILRIASDADILLILVDQKDGPTEWDRLIIQKIRVFSKPVLLVVNKCDSGDTFDSLNDFYEFGLGEPFPISAIHNVNIAELLDHVAEILKDFDFSGDEEETDESGIRITLIGRQNVGKSTLFNAIVGAHRAIVSDIPGTTRDAVDTAIEIEGEKFVFVDTAGLKKRTRVTESIDFYATRRTENALDKSEIALLLIDATDGVLDTDKKVAGLIQEKAKACVLVVSKWDESEDKPGHREMFEKHARKRLHFLDHAPIVFTSGMYNEGIEDLFPAIREVHGEYHKMIPTSEWNRALSDAVEFRPPPSLRGKRIRLKYITQTAVAPPIVNIYVNQAEYLREHYKRYLENYFRERFGFKGSPLIMNFRSREPRPDIS